MQVTDAMVEAGAVASFFRNVQPVSDESIAMFRKSDAFPVWCDQSRSALEAAIAAADAGKPSKEEFGKALDELMDASGDAVRALHWWGDARKRAALTAREAARREVERMAGYGEEG